jgi:iron complex transport system substrate-binding protein
VNASRRAVLTGAAAAFSSPAWSQPTPGPQVYPAGAPAAILIWCVRPDALVGWSRPLGPAQRALLPAAAGRLPTLGMLTAGGPTANLEGVAARCPDLLIDYGDLGPGYSALAEHTRGRLGLPYHVIDGRLSQTPEALIQTGRLLGAEPRARRLADAAGAILRAWSARRVQSGPSFYYARGPDGLETGLTGSLAVEVMEGAGWRNVVTARRNALGRVGREQFAALDPEVVVTLDAGLARRMLADPFWSRMRGGRPRRIALLPDAPFGWVDRPPSLNRLLGCLWLTAPDPLRVGLHPSEAAARFHTLFYGRSLGAAEARRISPRILSA